MSWNRHQASENSSGEAGDDERLKKALTLLQQRKQLQRNVRALQQQSVNKELLSSTDNHGKQGWTIDVGYIYKPIYILRLCAGHKKHS